MGLLLRRAARQIGVSLLPQDCFLCADFAGTNLLCDACGKDLPRISELACPVCALPTPNGETCGACLSQPPFFDATCCCFRYAFPVDRLVQALKFQQRLVVAKFFSEAMLEVISTMPLLADLLLALPLSDERLSQRGFNQSLEIARPIAQQRGWNLPTRGYRRTLDTAPQSSLPWRERGKNIRGAFECDLDLSGKNLVVVDDVMTTGASLNEFARVLKQHGARSVTNLVAARALRH